MSLLEWEIGFSDFFFVLLVLQSWPISDYGSFSYISRIGHYGVT